MGCGTSFVKYVLFFFNLLVTLLGLAIIGVGVAIYVNWSVINDELKTHMIMLSRVFIIFGVIMFVVTFFGCCGAIKENYCMVVTYAMFLLVFIISRIGLAIFLFNNTSTVEEGLISTVSDLWVKHSKEPAIGNIFMKIQEQLQCCGNNTSGDYKISALPKSCCPKDTNNSSNECPLEKANEGCSPVIAKLYEKWNKPLLGIIIGIACIEVVGALLALSLANYLRSVDGSQSY